MADLRAAMADVIQCHEVHTRGAQEAMADAILAMPEFQAIREAFRVLSRTNNQYEAWKVLQLIAPPVMWWIFDREMRP